MSKNLAEDDMPCIMGILNATPDSFSDVIPDFYEDSDVTQKVLEEKLEKIVNDGAKIVDIGGESTKPGCTPISWEQEWHRIEKILKTAVLNTEICVSVDTYHIETAKLALEAGANIINDVECTTHFEKMLDVVKDFDAQLIVTHNSRKSKNFSEVHDPVEIIINEFKSIIKIAEKMKFDMNKLIFDPGVGFGKTAEQNLAIVRGFGRISNEIPYPIVCAVSKKSLFKKISDDKRNLSVLTAVTTFEGFRKGCKIFRVHDVAENLAVLNLAKQIL